jgi:hypothetical protein
VFLNELYIGGSQVLGEALRTGALSRSLDQVRQ